MNFKDLKRKYSKTFKNVCSRISARPLLCAVISSALVFLILTILWLKTTSSSQQPFEQIAQVVDATEASAVASTDVVAENPTSFAEKIASLGKKIGIQVSSPSPTTTPAPQIENSGTGNSNQAANTPTPSQSTNGPTQPSVTPTIVTTVTPIQPSPTRVAATPTPTLVPTVVPTAGPVQSNASITLNSASGATPNAHGSVSFNITQNSNGYWDFITSGSFQMLQPNRPYQLWICADGCSSHVNARFTTDGAGAGSFSNTTINYPQGLYPAQTVRVNELVNVPAGEEIPTDSTRCFQMTGMTPCLQSSVSF